MLIIGLAHDVVLLAKPFMPDDLGRALANLHPDGAGPPEAEGPYST